MAAKHFADKGVTGEVDPEDRVEAGLTTRKISERTAGVTSRHRPKARQAKIGRHGTVLILGAIAVLIALITAAVIILLPNLLRQPDSNSEATTVTITVAEGSAATTVASSLQEAGVIDDTSEFLTRLTNRGDDANIKPGTYRFATGADIDDVIDQLVSGPNVTDAQITIPEGTTVAGIAKIVEDKLGISQDDFLAQAKASNYSSEYSFLTAAQNDSLEGFLWPKTYDFSGQDITADTVIRAMLNQFVTEKGAYDFSSAEAQLKTTYGVDFDDYDILTLASIIEKEAFTSEDRPLVASVFYNRLRDGMRLQSDATMAYVTGGEVTASDLKKESPYNTYLIDGLPPTPICSPSVESLEAALNPSSTDYLYFLLIEDGDQSVHAFSKTYEEHQAAIANAAGSES